MIREKKPLVWLELTGCSGNIISLLNASDDEFKSLITQMVDLVYSNSLMAAEGEEALQRLEELTSQEFILIIEGAVSTKNNGFYNIIGRRKGKLITALEIAKELGAKAKYVLAVGTCASSGGVSAASPNPSASRSVQALLGRRVINLPGCPCHPDWVIGTLIHLVMYGEPPLDALGRPLMFYGALIHDRCPRRSLFDRGIFARELGEGGCMFKLGCRGPVTRVDCPTRLWNNHLNWPIGNNTPCIGCAQFGFPDQMEPFVNYNTAKDSEGEKHE